MRSTELPIAGQKRYRRVCLSKFKRTDTIAPQPMDPTVTDLSTRLELPCQHRFKSHNLRS